MEGFELAKIKGISLKVHPSWFLVLIIFTRLSQEQFSRISEDPFSVWQSWCLGLLTAILLFLSVVVRELCHSFMALHEGIKVYAITIFSLGGVKRVDKQSSTPMATFKIAIAGPLSSLILGFLCLAFIQFFQTLNPSFINLLKQISGINFLLAIINLLPGLPFDGGVILKSFVWHLTGSQRKGDKAANTSGRLLSLIVIFFGSLILFIFKGGVFIGLCLIVVGWFGFNTSRSQDQILVLQQALSDLSVKDVSRRRFRVLEEDQSLKTLSQLNLTSSKENGLPQWVLLCRAGRWVGYITDQPLKDISAEHWDKYAVSEYKRPISDLPSISEKTPLWKAVLKLENLKEKQLLVFSFAGLPSGTLDKVDLAEAVLKKIGINLPTSFLQLARRNNIYPLGISLFNIVERMIDSGLIQKSDLDDSIK